MIEDPKYPPAASAAAAGTMSASHYGFVANAIVAVAAHGAIVYTDDARLSDIASHLSDTNNPHQVTASQVGAYTTGEIDTMLSGISGPDLTDYVTTGALGTALESYALQYDLGLVEQTVQSAAEAIAGHVLETTEAHGGIVATDDARLSDDRDPKAHAASHGSGQIDAIAIEQDQVSGLARALTEKASYVGTDAFTMPQTITPTYTSLPALTINGAAGATQPVLNIVLNSDIPAIHLVGFAGMTVPIFDSQSSSYVTKLAVMPDGRLLAPNHVESRHFWAAGVLAAGAIDGMWIVAGDRVLKSWRIAGDPTGEVDFAVYVGGVLIGEPTLSGTAAAGTTETWMGYDTGLGGVPLAAGDVVTAAITGTPSGCTATALMLLAEVR